MDNVLLKKYLSRAQLEQCYTLGRILVRGSSGRFFIVPNTSGPRCTAEEPVFPFERSGKWRIPRRIMAVFDSEENYLYHWCVGLEPERTSNIQNLIALKFNLEFDDSIIESELENNGGLGKQWDFENTELYGHKIHVKDAIEDLAELREIEERYAVSNINL